MKKCSSCGTEIPDGSRFCSTCGADQTDEGSTGRGGGTVGDLYSRLTRLVEGRYRLEHLIGRGGMGAVFRAEDLTLERPVAIKVLPPEMSHDENFVARFQREARTAAKLDHPGIIPIYAVESQEGLHYFVMKFITGRGLDQVLESGPMPVETAQRVLWQAATALGHAHQRQVIHRDIKPANIMIDEAGRAVLTDFGISKAMQASSQLTATGQVIGTPHYMSPEQAKGQPVDGRSDQYSLAMVGYRMLGGQLPFQDDSVHTILYKQIFEDPPLLKELNPEVPEHLVDAIHRALSKDPADRFGTMEEFATAIWPENPVAAPAGARAAAATTGPSITEQPTEITPTTPTPPAAAASRAAAPTKKKRPVVGIAAGILVLVAIGGGVGVWLAQQQGAGSDGTARDTGWVDVTMADESPVAPGGTEVAADTPEPAQPREPEPEPVQDTPPATRTDPPPAPPPQRQERQPPPVRDPEPQPVPRTGFLTLNATPFGTVLIDGAEIGDTPIVGYEVGVGRHVIRVVREGYQPIVDTVVVAVGGTVRKNYILIREEP